MSANLFSRAQLAGLVAQLSECENHLVSHDGCRETGSFIRFWGDDWQVLFVRRAHNYRGE